MAILVIHTTQYALIILARVVIYGEMDTPGANAKQSGTTQAQQQNKHRAEKTGVWGLTYGFYERWQH